MQSTFDNKINIIPSLSPGDGLLSISGIDASKFLQGQLTCDVTDVSDQDARLGAHCNPQGRIISLFRLCWFQEQYFLIMPSTLIPIAIKALQKYAVFFKVQIKDVTHNQLNYQEYFKKTTKLFDIMAGIPTIYPETSEKFLPHEINLPELNGVSFKKGCYTGQEIIARMEYRAKLKNKMFRAFVKTSFIPNRGSPIYEASQPKGSLVDYYQKDQNHYELLVIAPIISNNDLSLDPENKIILQFVNR